MVDYVNIIENTLLLFHPVFVGTCVCGECTCYDVDPSGDWGDIHGDTCECDERSCHAMYDRYSDDFCSGEALVEHFCQTSRSYYHICVVYIKFVSHMSLWQCVSKEKRLKCSVLASSNPLKRKWFTFQNPAVKILTLLKKRTGWNCLISVHSAYL